MAKHKHTYTAVFFHFSLFLSLQEFRFDITRTNVATLLIGWPWFRSLFEFGDTWKHNVNIPFCNCRPIVAVISDCNDAKHLITYFQFRITSSISNRLTAIFVTYSEFELNLANEREEKTTTMKSNRLWFSSCRLWNLFVFFYLFGKSIVMCASIERKWKSHSLFILKF